MAGFDAIGIPCDAPTGSITLVVTAATAAAASRDASLATLNLDLNANSALWLDALQFNGTQQGSYPVNYTGTQAGAYLSVVFSGFTTVDGALNGGVGTSASLVAPTINAPGADWLVCCFASDSQGPITLPADLTPILSIDGVISMAMGFRILSGKGQTGKETATTAASGNWAAFQALLTPGATPALAGYGGACIPR